MPEEKTTAGATAEHDDPGGTRPEARATAGVSPETLHQRQRVLEEQERFMKKVTAKQQALKEDEEQYAEAIDTERLNAEKLLLYESFVSGKINRGALDRKLDELYARSRKSKLDTPPPQTPREPEANRIVTTYMWWSAGSGIIPIPVLDTLALTTIQVLMLRDLCKLYEIPFSQQWGKELIGILLGGLTPGYLKAIPGIGTVLGIIISPIFNVASTYAVGKVFTQHFESGGTMLTFDPAKMKKYFREYYETGRTLARS
jgi:uncharacterized protein (DUF697 family)